MKAHQIKNVLPIWSNFSWSCSNSARLRATFTRPRPTQLLTYKKSQNRAHIFWEVKESETCRTQFLKTGFHQRFCPRPTYWDWPPSPADVGSPSLVRVAWKIDETNGSVGPMDTNPELPLLENATSFLLVRSHWLGLLKSKCYCWVWSS